jgi:hypothetical protein
MLEVSLDEKDLSFACSKIRRTLRDVLDQWFPKWAWGAVGLLREVL